MTSDHWERIHASKGADVSWWQERDDLWLDVVDALQLSADDPVIDMGAGSSMWVDAMVGRGFTDITAVDVALSGLLRIKDRLGDRIRYEQCDALDFIAPRPVRLWHDRAVLHFLVDEGDQLQYARNLRASLDPDGYAVVATFAPDGPESCSGLPVRRWAATELAAALGLRLMTSARRTHTTPWGTDQPFTVAVLQP